MDTREKILSLEQAQERLASAKEAGVSHRLAHGWFDVLRSEHAATLRRAKDACDLLIVAVHGNTRSRPTVLDETSRAQLVASLRCVDGVVICDEAAGEELRRSVDAASFVDAEQSVAGSVIDEVLRRHGRG